MKLETLAPPAVAVGFALVVMSYFSFWVPGQTPSEEKIADLGQARAHLHELSSGPLPGQSEAHHANDLLEAQKAFREQFEAFENAKTRGHAARRVVWWAGALLAAAGVFGFLATRSE